METVKTGKAFKTGKTEKAVKTEKASTLLNPTNEVRNRNIHQIVYDTRKEMYVVDKSRLHKLDNVLFLIQVANLYNRALRTSGLSNFQSSFNVQVEAVEYSDVYRRFFVNERKVKAKSDVYFYKQLAEFFNTGSTRMKFF